MVGFALGGIGISLTDFDRLTIEEFEEVAAHWERFHVRDSWEQARFTACASLQPYSKKALKVTDVCKFSWEQIAKSAHLQAAEASTKERFDEIVKRLDK
ncbi:MAG: hypothetical protein ACRCUJ_01760 [Phocaeicola sp.]